MIESLIEKVVPHKFHYNPLIKKISSNRIKELGDIRKCPFLLYLYTIVYKLHLYIRWINITCCTRKTVFDVATDDKSN